jgi:hypothetical protein
VIVGMQDHVRLMNLNCRNDSADTLRRQFRRRCGRRAMSAAGRSRKTSGDEKCKVFYQGHRFAGSNQLAAAHVIHC